MDVKIVIRLSRALGFEFTLKSTANVNLEMDSSRFL